MKPTIKQVTYFDPIHANAEGFEKALVTKLSKLASESKAMTHVDSGNLRNSIMWRTTRSEGGLKKDKENDSLEYQPKKMQGVCGGHTYYFVYEEFGTRYRPAHPMFRAAIALVNGMDKALVIDKINESMAAENYKGSAKVKFF